MRNTLLKLGKSCACPLAVGALIVGIGSMPVCAQAYSTITSPIHESFSITGSGGSGGSGSIWSDMVFSSYGADGWGWAGGAGGVQGNAAITATGGTSSPSNEAFRFRIGATVDSLNTTYGAGNWTIANPMLAFSSSYSKQNNPRFGLGSGTFDIYWLGNDNWAQSKGTSTDRQLNPVYAKNEADLSTWAGTQALLGSETFTTGTSGYVNLSYDLSPASLFVNDLLSASATGGNNDVSLYLMATSDTLGMVIFTGGQGQALPTLSFDVVSAPAPVPEPGSVLLLGTGLLVAVGVVGIKRRVPLAS